MERAGGPLLRAPTCGYGKAEKRMRAIKWKAFYVMFCWKMKFSGYQRSFEVWGGEKGAQKWVTMINAEGWIFIFLLRLRTKLLHSRRRNQCRRKFVPFPREKRSFLPNSLTMCVVGERGKKSLNEKIMIMMLNFLRLFHLSTPPTSSPSARRAGKEIVEMKN